MGKRRFVIPAFIVVDSAENMTDALIYAEDLLSTTNATRIYGGLYLDEAMDPIELPEDYEVHSILDFMNIKPMTTDELEDRLY